MRCAIWLLLFSTLTGCLLDESYDYNNGYGSDRGYGYGDYDDDRYEYDRYGCNRYGRDRYGNRCDRRPPKYDDRRDYDRDDHDWKDRDDDDHHHHHGSSHSSGSSSRAPATPPPPPEIKPSCPSGTRFDGSTCKITDNSLKRKGGDGDINPCPKGMWVSGGRCVGN